MPLVHQHFEFAPVAVQLSIEDVIIRIVDQKNGIKDIDLTEAVLLETGEIFNDGHNGMLCVAESIHNLINAGRLVGVDCETKLGDFTMVLPGGSRPTIAMPIYIRYSGTRH